MFQNIDSTGEEDDGKLPHEFHFPRKNSEPCFWFLLRLESSMRCSSFQCCGNEILISDRAILFPLFSLILFISNIPLFGLLQSCIMLFRYQPCLLCQFATGRSSCLPLPPSIQLRGWLQIPIACDFKCFDCAKHHTSFVEFDSGLIRCTFKQSFLN